MLINRYQYISTASASLCIMTSAMHFGWPSPSIPKLRNGYYLDVTNEESSWIAVMPLITSIFSAMFAGSLLNFIGRKNTILLTGIPYIFSWLIIAFARNVDLIYFARFLAGLADGLTYTAVPMYIGEIADPRIRGFLGSSCTVSMDLGILLINGLGLYLNIFTTALISTLLPLLFLATFYFMPKSPYYLIMKGRYDNAKESLKTLRGIKYVDPEFNRIVDNVKEDASDTGHLLDLFSVPSNRKALLILIGLNTVQQLSGIAAITFYTHTIFQEVGQHVSSEHSTVAYYVMQLVMTCLSSLIVDKVGRRPLMIISCVGTMLTLMSEGIYFYLQINTTIDLIHFKYVPVGALVGFIICYCIGIGTIPVFMLGELFPTNVKAFAICLSDIYFSIVATIASKFFQIMKDNFGIYVPFFCFAICCCLGILFVIMCLPETKGKTLEEIQDELKGIRKQ